MNSLIGTLLSISAVVVTADTEAFFLRRVTQIGSNFNRRMIDRLVERSSSENYNNTAPCVLHAI